MSRKIILRVLLLAPFGLAGCGPLPRVAGQAAVRTELCAIEERMLKVRGDSLTGLIDDGAVMKVALGYYKCHEVLRGDIVLYNYPGGDPLVKIAKGVPGDKLRLRKTRRGCWNILINGRVLKNSLKVPYCIGARESEMLALYERGNNGVIPGNACLIMANLPGGSMDSTRFGLVGRADLLGRVLWQGR